MYATEAFGPFFSTVKAGPLPVEVLHHAKRALIDWHAALFPGLDAEAVQRLRGALEEEFGRGNATLPGGQHVTARVAALLNGAAAHAAEIDDSFRDAMYHPGAPTIAAAIAAAQDVGAAGELLLKGIVVGYEVSTRIGVVLGRAHYRYWHSTATVGTFGAAAAAAFIYGATEEQLAHALATAATFAAGLQQAFRMDSMSKPLHVGRAAEGGVLAARAAVAGITGSLDVLDGETGLGRAMSDGPEWGALAATLGTDFHICRLTFKNHIGCGHTFAAIDGALALKAKLGIDTSQIRHIHVATYRPALEIACYLDPQTENEAKFSLKYIVATALVHGSVRLPAYTPERLRDDETRRLMDCMTIVVDPEIDEWFPGKRAARVEIETLDGAKADYLQQNRKGDPEDPLSDADLDGKLMELASPIVGVEAARRLAGRIWHVESESICELFA
ncbi:Immune-responsive protein 1 (plasmid) [Cupriavidus necator H850]|jgi:2-methylcitrate dehydratase PrpD|uniref:MmgE/PrpD family protein n=1 Tax=Cupriavidus TaxID=106589 RepID=UPI00129D2DC2|nr:MULTISPECIES: MmgE/PrpD family protein [Cupriavidus]KAI3604107.1 Immune-responsive protein 1 [Cupriavidus necator H850]QUN31879.1 MmgE/PrpD family protein [Cupriavidus sp. KK10]